jgi:hypothetical protein
MQPFQIGYFHLVICYKPSYAGGSRSKMIMVWDQEELAVRPPSQNQMQTKGLEHNSSGRVLAYVRINLGWVFSFKEFNQ